MRSLALDRSLIRRIWIVVLGLIAFGVASQASAQPTSQSRAAAQALFEEAGTLYKEGKYAEACSKLADSHRLDPASGTLMNLGRCYQKIGKTASAWVAYLDAVAAARKTGQPERERLARDAANALVSVLPKLVIEVPAGVAVPGFEIKRDGDLVPNTLWNGSAPADPGDHEIVCSAPNKKPWSKTVRLEAGQSTKVLVPPLEDAPTAVSTGLTTDDASGAEPSGLGTRRVAALAAGGIGVVALGLGTGFGLAAMSKEKEADASCSGAFCPTDDALSANESAKSNARLATAFFGAGVVMLGTGAVLWLTSPSSKPKEPPRSTGAARLSFGPAPVGNFGIAVRGAF